MSDYLWRINNPPDESVGHYIQEYPEDMPETEWSGYEDYMKEKKRKRRIWNVIAIVMTPFLLFCLVFATYEIFSTMLFFYHLLEDFLF